MLYGAECKLFTSHLIDDHLCPHLLESSRRLELLVARLADSRSILPLGGVARRFDRGSELEKEQRVRIKKAAFGGANNAHHNHGREYRLSGLDEEEGVDH